jgi:hypothetical protein
LQNLIKSCYIKVVLNELVAYFIGTMKKLHAFL